ncbi:unnamed protein product [Owenia fusiformis]|uniref:SAM domain-containing protein n=1 Tax=Owenia fusiformis TaxID=6347 RepID=A0A8S4N3J6_OWEFU|nr:unnamed protein product [Owenia fusiformis]
MANHDDLKDERVPLCLHWSVEKVADWIEEIGFPYYRECITRNLVDGKRLIHIDSSHLPKIGITDFEHIKLIAKCIRDMLEIEDPDWHRSISKPPRENLGMYLEMKSGTGERRDERTYKKFLANTTDAKWQPPLANHCLILPH